jgi:conjugative transfer signal peptidase TraF
MNRMFGNRRALTPRAKLRLVLSVAGALGATFCAVAVAQAEGIWINTTDSMPMGLWRATPTHGTQRGDVVLLCLPNTPTVQLGQSRGYIAPGPCPTGQEIVLKPVAAAAGDLVDITSTGVRVNGTPIPNSGQLVHDSAGRPMPRMAAGEYRVPPGELWLVSGHNPRSFDSRYFGPVPAALVRTSVRPLLVVE